MPPESTTPSPLLTSAPHHQSNKKTVLIVLGAALLIIMLAMAGWYGWQRYLMYKHAKDVEARIQLLNSLPENPYAKDLTFEQKTELLK